MQPWVPPHCVSDQGFSGYLSLKAALDCRSPAPSWDGGFQDVKSASVTEANSPISPKERFPGSQLRMVPSTVSWLQNRSSVAEGPSGGDLTPRSQEAEEDRKGLAEGGLGPDLTQGHSSMTCSCSEGPPASAVSPEHHPIM